MSSLKEIIASGSMESAAPIIEAMTDEQLVALAKEVDEYYEAECKRIDEVWTTHQFTPAAFFNDGISAALRGHAEASKFTVLAVTSEIATVIELVKESRKGNHEQKG